mmetsp:Transcript_141346/g.439322  ORF Transcript_141346/g.439322 Transcript_141346/m.439322 type:complete len:200 (-) Transcript_141346:86-685(-)
MCGLRAGPRQGHGLAPVRRARGSGLRGGGGGSSWPREEAVHSRGRQVRRGRGQRLQAELCLRPEPPRPAAPDAPRLRSGRQVARPRRRPARPDAAPGPCGASTRPRAGCLPPPATRRRALPCSPRPAPRPPTALPLGCPPPPGAAPAPRRGRRRARRRSRRGAGRRMARSRAAPMGAASEATGRTARPSAGGPCSLGHP